MLKEGVVSGGFGKVLLGMRKGAAEVGRGKMKLEGGRGERKGRCVLCNTTLRGNRRFGRLRDGEGFQQRN